MEEEIKIQFTYRYKEHNMPPFSPSAQVRHLSYSIPDSSIILFYNYYDWEGGQMWLTALLKGTPLISKGRLTCDGNGAQAVIDDLEKQILALAKSMSVGKKLV